MKRRLRKIPSSASCTPSDFPQCAICIDDLHMQEFRGLLPCSHSAFCFQCILEWSQISNSCPLCKTRFNSLQKVSYCGNILLAKMECICVEDRDQKTPEYDPPYIDVRCMMCGTDTDEEIMLLCDRCDSGFHTVCIGLRDIPELENWYCDECLVDMPYSVQEYQIETILSMQETQRNDQIHKHRRRLRRAADQEVESRLR